MAAVKRQGVTDEGVNKRQRMGVGSSVVDLVRGPGDDFHLILAKLNATRLRPKGHTVITIDRYDTLPVLCHRLLTFNFLSLPVVSKDGKFLGFVDQRDVVSFISNMFTDYESVSLVDVQKVFDSEERFKRALVLDIMKSQRRKINPYFPLKQGVSLFTVWEFLVVEGLHRIPMIGMHLDLLLKDKLFCLLPIATHLRLFIFKRVRCHHPIHVDRLSVAKYRKIWRLFFHQTRVGPKKSE
eukprot:TRINITY_DN6225_c0_g1_i10.p1 TRINITY_DN6225_c0_g1~~TRINITY_DN6225_c0_g1_i10.p1  ORF type:complete len:239 (+),score=30.93 TRINITY_DN6225_c0_g1_i10:349-1065(+)